ncbi:MAG: helix-turn-helix domain-containing protein, partial [Planctomycetes bacterium]|nr:helix-turn-helix domain-containing protein [Planctomycetota bacterium]
LRAEQLLDRPDLPVGAVGRLAGFPDPTVFGRIFHAARGCSPSAWRSRAQARHKTRR